MKIQTFALKCDEIESLASEMASVLTNEKPSLLIGYGNTDFPLEAIPPIIGDSSLPFFISSSCLGALLCDDKTVSAKCDLALFCINDDSGAYGVGSADISESSPFEAGSHV